MTGVQTCALPIFQGLFVSIEDAIAKAKSTGFQYRIDEFNVESTGKVIFAGISKKQW